MASSPVLWYVFGRSLLRLSKMLGFCGFSRLRCLLIGCQAALCSQSSLLNAGVLPKVPLLLKQVPSSETPTLLHYGWNCRSVGEVG
jgi:hypothetical protein